MVEFWPLNSTAPALQLAKLAMADKFMDVNIHEHYDLLAMILLAGLLLVMLSSVLSRHGYHPCLHAPRPIKYVQLAEPPAALTKRGSGDKIFSAALAVRSVAKKTEGEAAAKAAADAENAAYDAEGEAARAAAAAAMAEAKAKAKAEAIARKAALEAERARAEAEARAQQLEMLKQLQEVAEKGLRVSRWQAAKRAVNFRESQRQRTLQEEVQ